MGGMNSLKSVILSGTKIETHGNYQFSWEKG